MPENPVLQNSIVGKTAFITMLLAYGFFITAVIYVFSSTSIFSSSINQPIEILMYLSLFSAFVSIVTGIRGCYLSETRKTLAITGLSFSMIYIIFIFTCWWLIENR